MASKFSSRFAAISIMTPWMLILSLSGCASLAPPCPATKPTLNSLTFQKAPDQMVLSKTDAAELLKYVNDLEYCVYNRIPTAGSQ